MKKIGIVCFVILLFGVTSANAQGLLDKIDNALNKAERAGNSAEKAGKTGGKLGSLFGKKKTTTEAENNTTVNISGVDFATLKGINEKLQTDKAVAGTKMKFSSTGSTLTLQHSGTTEDLLKVLQKASPNIFAEKNIEAMDDGVIAIKVKK